MLSPSAPRISSPSPSISPPTNPTTDKMYSDPELFVQELHQKYLLHLQNKQCIANGSHTERERDTIPKMKKPTNHRASHRRVSSAHNLAMVQEIEHAVTVVDPITLDNMQRGITLSPRMSKPRDYSRGQTVRKPSMILEQDIENAVADADGQLSRTASPKMKKPIRRRHSSLQRTRRESSIITQDIKQALVAVDSPIARNIGDTERPGAMTSPKMKKPIRRRFSHRHRENPPPNMPQEITQALIVVDGAAPQATRRTDHDDETTSPRMKKPVRSRTSSQQRCARSITGETQEIQLALVAIDGSPDESSDPSQQDDRIASEFHRISMHCATISPRTQRLQRGKPARRHSIRTQPSTLAHIVEQHISPCDFVH